MKKLVLIGGGHANVHVLKSLAQAPLADVDVTLISPFARQVYSGMLPGWIAGHYTIDECVIPLQPLAQRAHARFIESAATHINFAANEIACANDTVISFDTISIDTGPVANVDVVEGAREHAIAVRPIERFIEAMVALKARVQARYAAGRGSHIAVVGAGAAGVEIALALQFSLQEVGAKVTIISAENTLPGRVAPRIDAALARHHVRQLKGNAAKRITQHQIDLADGTRLEVDEVIVSLGTAAADWPRASGLRVDARGFILTNHFFQSVTHSNVFAVGDCASMENIAVPKSGVYAVRAGQPLAANLRRYLCDEALIAYTPNLRSLYLISTGEKHAIASWGPLAWEGEWVWQWKDNIDRIFVAKYS